MLYIACISLYSTKIYLLYFAYILYILLINLITQNKSHTHSSLLKTKKQAYIRVTSMRSYQF